MKILIDTNVILDTMLNREKKFYSDKILELCAESKISGYVAFHTLPTVWYIMEKYKIDAKRDKIRYLCEILNVVSLTNLQVLDALNNINFRDFEDCLQYMCAKDNNVDCIVTNNVTDFSNSEIIIKTSENFINDMNF